MNLTDELRKLADLKAEGQLTEQEFADAKRKLLAQGPADSSPPRPMTAVGTAPNGPPVADKTYWSSRWSKGNLFFRDSLTLGSDGILFRKGRMFGSQEERINYRAVASLRVTTGMFLANLSIETSGGSQPIFINGLWKSDAKQIQDAVRVFQQRG
jgi:putative oligomerization/nucleic acid binding protein